MNKQKNIKCLKSAMKKGKQDIGLMSDGIIFHRVCAIFHVDLYSLINTHKKHCSSFPSSQMITNKTNTPHKSCVRDIWLQTNKFTTFCKISYSGLHLSVMHPK